jgi:hypothetical protein
VPVRQSLEDLFLQAVTDPLTGQAMTPGADRRSPAHRPPLQQPPAYQPANTGGAR